MEFTDLVAALEKGGPVVMVVAVWIAFRAGRTAQEATKALTDIRDTVVKHSPVLEEIAKSSRAAEETGLEIQDWTRSADMKLAAITANQRTRA